MKITLNGKMISLPDEGQTLSGLRSLYGFCGEDTVSVLNGYQTEDGALCEGDSVFLLKKGDMPSEDELEEMLCARHTPHVHERLKAASVGIAGCGGLGSNIAVSLARSGVGKLVIADFDTVEPTNLNRQQYLIKHLGMAKVEALKALIAEINPYVSVVTHCTRINGENAAEIFGECSVVCEAFDKPEAKAELVNALLSVKNGAKVIAAAGMAGLSACNDIITRKVTDRLYICGDGVTEAAAGTGLMAPRVAVCAGHQANAVLNLLLGNEAV